MNLKSQVVANAATISELKNSLTQQEKEIKKYSPASCIDKETDIYEIRVNGSNPFNVSCDASLVDAGWTVIQRRQGGTVNFNRTMKDDRLGFGDIKGRILHRSREATPIDELSKTRAVHISKGLFEFCSICALQSLSHWSRAGQVSAQIIGKLFWGRRRCNGS